MINEGKYMTTFEIEEAQREASSILYDTKFNFLRQHNGFRNSNIHLILGTSGGGKSTTVRTLLIDILPKVPRGKKLLLWLSEETAEEFFVEINKSGLIEHGRPLLDKLDIFSEQEHIDDSAQQLEFKMSEFVKSGQYGFLIFDNLTTSEMYMGRKPNEQGAFSKRLKAKIQETRIPLLIVAHTKAEVTDNMHRLIESNDIRDSKSIVNLAQFIYVLQTFYINEKRINTLRIVKNRGQLVEQSMFVLKFEPKTFLFGTDRAIDFNEFKSIFKERNKL